MKSMRLQEWQEVSPENVPVNIRTPAWEEVSSSEIPLSVKKDWEEIPVDEVPKEIIAKKQPQDFWEKRREVVGHKKPEIKAGVGQAIVESFITEPIKRTYQDIVESGKKALAGEGNILEQIPFKGLRYAAGRLIKEGGLPVPVMNLVMPALIKEEQLQKVKAGQEIPVSETALKAMGGLNKLIGIYPISKVAGGLAAAKIKTAPYLAGAPELAQRVVEGVAFWGTAKGVDESYKYLEKEKELTLKNITKSGGAIIGEAITGGTLGMVNALPAATIRIPAAGVTRFAYEAAKEKLNPREPKNTLNKYVNTGMQMLLAAFTGLDMNAIKRKMVEGAIDVQTVDNAMETAGQFLPAKFVNAPLEIKTEFLTKTIEKLNTGETISKVIPEVIEKTKLDSMSALPPPTPIKLLEPSLLESEEGLMELPDIPTRGRMETWGKWIKTWLGTKKEGLQAQFGEEKGEKVYKTLEKMNASLNLGQKELEKRNKTIFNIAPRIRNHIFDILKGIDGKDAQGNIKFGALQRAGVASVKEVSEGQVLEDGRIGGPIHPQNKRQRLLYRKFNTEAEYNKLITKYPKTEGMIDKYLAEEEQILKTKLGTEVPAFAHKVFEEQYDIQTTRPSETYVPSVRAARVPLRTKVKNLFRTVSPSGAKFKKGTLAEAGLEERDILKAYTSKQVEFLKRDITHEAAAKVLATLLEPIEGHKITPGYTQLNVHHPKIAEVIKDNIELFQEAGLDVEGKALFQYPSSIERYIKLQSSTPFAGELGEVHNKAVSRFNKGVSYITTNYLTRLSTANRNFISGQIQYGLRPLTHLYEGLLGAGIRPVIEDVKALGTALTPKAIKEIPGEVLGKTFFSGLAERKSLLGTALIPFSSIETYFKRVSFIADLNTVAYKASKEAQIPYGKKTQYIKDFKENYFVDLFHWLRDNSDSVTYDYDNSPLLLKYVPKSIVPYPKYAYNKFRMYMEYSPLGLFQSGKAKPLPEILIKEGGEGIDFKEVKGGWKTLRHRIAKALAGTTMASIMWQLADKTVKKREKDMERLSLKKLDWEFDTVGRLQVYGDKELERYLRVYDIPFLGDIMYWREIMQGSANFSDWLSDGLALGPAMIAPLALFGFKRRPDQYKPTAAVVGEQVAGWIPFGAYLRYMRILQDPVKRKTFSDDYNAFQNFMSPIAGRLPGTSEVLPTRKPGEETRYDIPAETMKLFFLNMKSIDKYEFLAYEQEQFVSGKVSERRIKQFKKERGL